MDASPRNSGDHRPDAYPDDVIRGSYRQIVRTCICAGLSPADSEDVGQDIWMWMLRVGVPLSLIATPWLSAVVHNHVLRFRRRNHSHRLREGYGLETAPEPWSSPFEARVESNELLDRVASALPRLERRLLALIRNGYSLPEATRHLGIPPGSRAYYRGRLIACARLALRRPTATRKKLRPDVPPANVPGAIPAANRPNRPPELEP